MASTNRIPLREREGTNDRAESSRGTGSLLSGRSRAPPLTEAEHPSLVRLAADRPGLLPASHAAEGEADAFASLSFDYTLATELVDGAIPQLVVAAAEGHRVGEGALEYRQPTLHAVIDTRLRRELEPLLRHLVLRNRQAVPGIDLGLARGFRPELGDLPENVPSAGPGTAAG